MIEGNGILVTKMNGSIGELERPTKHIRKSNSIKISGDIYGGENLDQTS